LLYVLSHVVQTLLLRVRVVQREHHRQVFLRLYREPVRPRAQSQSRRSTADTSLQLCSMFVDGHG
jgi:hypothetical protein